MKLVNLNNFDVICSWNSSKKEKATIAVYFEVGSYDDGRIEGIAHFIEHMLVMGLNDYPIYSKNNIIVRATTDIFSTIYYIECENVKSEISKALEVAELLISGVTLSNFYMDLVREDILKEYELYRLKVERESSYILFKQFNLHLKLPIGNLDAVRKVQYNDIIQFYNEYYLTCNKKIVIVGKYQKKEGTTYHLKEDLNEDNKRILWKKLGFKKYIYQNRQQLCLAWGNLLEIEFSVEKIEVILIALQIVIEEHYNDIISSLKICSYGKRSLFICVEMKKGKIIYDENKITKDIIVYLNKKVFSLAKKHYFQKIVMRNRDIIGELQNLLFLIKNDMQISDKKELKHILKYYSYDEFILNVKQILQV